MEWRNLEINFLSSKFPDCLQIQTKLPSEVQAWLTTSLLGVALPATAAIEALPVTAVVEMREVAERPLWCHWMLPQQFSKNHRYTHPYMVMHMFVYLLVECYTKHERNEHPPQRNKDNRWHLTNQNHSLTNLQQNKIERTLKSQINNINILKLHPAIAL